MYFLILDQLHLHKDVKDLEHMPLMWFDHFLLEICGIKQEVLYHMDFFSFFKSPKSEVFKIQ